MNAIDLSQVGSRVAQVRERIKIAGGSQVKLIAVTKTFDAAAMIADHRLPIERKAEA